MDPSSRQSATNDNKSCININCFSGSTQQAPSYSSILQNQQTRQMMKETEDLLASELNKLTVQERTEALDDLHCVGAGLEETPEKIEELLAAFEQAVQRQQEPFYEMLVSRHKAYVKDRSFRLRFLRANMHNVDRAVSQMMHFLQNKARYFGDKDVGREITFDDLNEEDRELLLSGIYHIQKDKDRNGRVILYFFSEFIGNASPETLCRVAYYVYFNILIAIPEVQMKGLVFIFYDITKIDELPAMPGLNMTFAIVDMIKSLPIRFSARHFCLKTRQEKLELFNTLLHPVFKLSPDYSRVRSRLHYGSDMELQYQLRSVGININSCPINSDGALREDIKNAWFYEHRKMEQGIADPSVQPPLVLGLADAGRFTLDAQEFQMVDFNARHEDTEAFFGVIGNQHDEVKRSASSMVGAARKPKRSDHSENGCISPTDDDILLGRGRGVQFHPGNVRFRKFLVSYKDDYDTAPRSKRKEIVSQVTRVLCSRSVRFLKQSEDDDDVWVKSSEKETEKKIMQLFREFRKSK